ncbi:unnamed protein product [Moneuplotes crassus]|uniref:Uncharacterized protein n=1 Tax=Euplotes crassus TaxID=5936 RepID=A0AAD1Y7T9_EUPCR|nr:unnamed protein product [Moneuplotes crassus]
MGKSKSLMKMKKNPPLRLDPEDYDIQSSVSSLVGHKDDKPEGHNPIMKYSLNELFENPPVFDAPIINFNDDPSQNSWKLIANKVLSSKGRNKEIEGNKRGNCAPKNKPGRNIGLKRSRFNRKPRSIKRMSTLRARNCLKKASRKISSSKESTDTIRNISKQRQVSTKRGRFNSTDTFKGFNPKASEICPNFIKADKIQKSSAIPMRNLNLAEIKEDMTPLFQEKSVNLDQSEGFQECLVKRLSSGISSPAKSVSSDENPIQMKKLTKTRLLGKVFKIPNSGFKKRNYNKSLELTKGPNNRSINLLAKRFQRSVQNPTEDLKKAKRNSDRNKIKSAHRHQTFIPKKMKAPFNLMESFQSELSKVKADMDKCYSLGYVTLLNNSGRADHINKSKIKKKSKNNFEKTLKRKIGKNSSRAQRPFTPGRPWHYLNPRAVFAVGMPLQVAKANTNRPY